MTLPRRPEPHRHAARGLGLLVVLVLVGLSLGAAGPAAASVCGAKVIDDWYDGRIDGTYPLRCYDDAIRQLPRDLRDYSSAPDDIKRALSASMRGQPAPPNRDPAPTDEPPKEPPPVTTIREDPPSTTPKSETQPTVTSSGPDPPPTDTVASPPDTGSSASSVPIPLLVLAGLALLLIAGGSAGYVVRRFQARRLPPPTG